MKLGMRTVMGQRKRENNRVWGQGQGRGQGDGLQVVSQYGDQESGEGPEGQYRVGTKYRSQRSGICTDLDQTGVRGTG